MRKILIIRLTSLGDVIFTIPLACTLKDNIKDVEIGWVVAEKGLDVIKDNPCVDKVHFVPLKEWKKKPFSLKSFKEILKIIKELRVEKYDIAFDAQQMFKSLCLFLFCGAKRRITFKDARELSILGGNEFITPKAKFTDFDYHIVERNLDFARHLGIEPKKVRFSLPETTQEIKIYVDELIKDLDKTKPNVILAPATTWKNKHWDERNWAELIDAIHEKCNLIFTGMPDNWGLMARILNYCKNDVKYKNLIGKTNVEELRELFTRAKIVISPDSGSAHLAWASQIPSIITIFTCTPAKRFGPYDKIEEKYFTVAGNKGAIFECQPCFKKKCKKIEEKNTCQKYPKPEEIIIIVNKFL